MFLSRTLQQCFSKIGNQESLTIHFPKSFYLWVYFVFNYTAQIIAGYYVLLSSIQMFPWSATFILEPQCPSQRSPAEMVTHTLMQELGSLLKRTKRLCQERAAEIRRRSSCVDYSWLAVTQQKPSYEIMPGELLELQELCLKIPPSQCGPVILRWVIKFVAPRMCDSSHCCVCEQMIKIRQI